MGRTPPSRHPELDIPAPRPTRRNIPEVRQPGASEVVGTNTASPNDAAPNSAPSSSAPSTGAPKTPIEVTLPLKKRPSSRSTIGAARPRRVFVPTPVESSRGDARLEDQPTLPSGRTPPEETRVSGARSPAAPRSPSRESFALAPTERPPAASHTGEEVTSPAGPQAADAVRLAQSGKPTLLTRAANAEAAPSKRSASKPPSKATVPAFARAAPQRLLGSVAPSKEHGEPSAPADGPVLEVRRGAQRSSRGLAMEKLIEMMPGRVVGGRYAVGELVGRGAMGMIFAAEDLAPEPWSSRIALKLLDPEIAQDPAALERFRAEALAPRAIGSEHVVRIYEADACPVTMAALQATDAASSAALGPSEGAPYIAMEMLLGLDLRDHLRQRGPLPARELVGIVDQVATTLDRAHALGIVHRDLKPANLFLTRRPDGSQLVKILDFGVARLGRRSGVEGDPVVLTSSGGVEAGFFGTPWYMAPEQIEGFGATPASDRWALTLIIFRLLTGESYWAPAPIAELLAQIVAGPKTLPSVVIRARGVVPFASLGDAFDDWFVRACALDPAARFQSATEQSKALARALSLDARR